MKIGTAEYIKEAINIFGEDTLLPVISSAKHHLMEENEEYKKISGE